MSKLKVDILIANAGIGRGAEGILKATRNDIEVSTKINLESYLHLLKTIVPGMIKRRKGHVVLMGSLAGLYPQMSTVYGGQKGAIHRIAQSLRIELSGSRVKVSEICPGRTKTNFGNVAFDDKIKAKKGRKIEWLEFSFEPEKRIHSKRQSNMISTGKPKQYISREMTPQWLKNNTYEPTTSKTSAYTEEERQAFLQKMKK